MLTRKMKAALTKVRKRKFCAHWLIHKATLRALLKRRLVVPCGFYSVCLPENSPWSLVYFPQPEKAFD